MPLPYQYTYENQQFTVSKVDPNSKDLVDKLYALINPDSIRFIESLYAMRESKYSPIYAPTKSSWSRVYFDRILQSGFAVAIFDANANEPIACILVGAQPSIRPRRLPSMEEIIEYIQDYTPYVPPSIKSVYGTHNYFVYSAVAKPEYEDLHHIYEKLFYGVAKVLEVSARIFIDLGLLITLQKNNTVLASVVKDKIGFSSKYISGHEICGISAYLFTQQMERLQQPKPTVSRPAVKP